MSRTLEQFAKSKGTITLPKIQQPIHFSQWLARQVRRNGPIGDLSRSVRSDRCWPRRASDYIAFRNHLRIEHSNSPIPRIMALDAAWEEFVAFKNTFAMPGS